MLIFYLKKLLILLMKKHKNYKMNYDTYKLEEPPTNGEVAIKNQTENLECAAKQCLDAILLNFPEKYFNENYIKEQIKAVIINSEC